MSTKAVRAKTIRRKCFIGLVCLLYSGILPAQVDETREIYLKAGFQHMTLLDRQATPLPYEGAGPVLSLGFNMSNRESALSVNLYGGKLAYQPVSEEFRFYDREMTATRAGVSLSYLIRIKENDRLNVWLGPAATESILVDFDGIGPWPYLQAFGGVHAKASVDHTLREKHKLTAGVAVPLISWLTDMPYSQIPRVEGRAPDAASLFKSSTKIATWNRYQRVDFHAAYDVNISSRLNLKVSYDWAWFHDAQPFDMWTYQGSLAVGLGFTW